MGSQGLDDPQQPNYVVNGVLREGDTGDAARAQGVAGFAQPKLSSRRLFRRLLTIAMLVSSSLRQCKAVPKEGKLMKKRRPVATLNQSQTASTGHHCPRTGWWSVSWNEGDPTSITEGQLMPALGGLPTVWILREAAMRGPVRASTLISAS